ncbi:hypothetical protein F4818DRAFT_188194 [Hypoxylon cercidicola]|nr:hypothetical protein F4818DRAFT_188194 [Hypoxylon cercidicola]
MKRDISLVDGAAPSSGSKRTQTTQSEQSDVVRKGTSEYDALLWRNEIRFVETRGNIPAYVVATKTTILEPLEKGSDDVKNIKFVNRARKELEENRRRVEIDVNETTRESYLTAVFFLEIPNVNRMFKSLYGKTLDDRTQCLQFCANKPFDVLHYLGLPEPQPMTVAKPNV